MLSTQQPKRPTLQSQQQQQQHTNPLFQQQTRPSTVLPSKTTPPSDSSPKSQIEAMPPNKTQSPSPTIPQQAMPLYNPAVVHPVFFSDGWHKPPFPLPFNAGWSPAAAGYAFNSRQRSTNNTTKL
ncbi:hypothetical protein D0860_00720 [Hortaea werneckii]|uniref:Uncharacterized protein n=1 Tax=Hortaea werneckii TaxID=91943 RepID=A0A3M7HVB1_HORWE|nr:hypothetical protein D0860_00720 [Hortaea werneckii]